jgi:large subunit ribosomal protein L22
MRRKEKVAEKRREEKKTLYFATFNDCPTSPRKMRTVADLIRGQEAFKALGILKFNARHGSAGSLFKLLKSAIKNYEDKSGETAQPGTLFVTRLFVDGGPMIKRMLPAPQGRAYRVRKRSNHITLYVDKKQSTTDNSQLTTHN